MWYQIQHQVIVSASLFYPFHYQIPHNQETDIEASLKQPNVQNNLKYAAK